MVSSVTKTVVVTLLLTMSAWGEGGATQGDIRESVVKILVKQERPDLLRPWTKMPPEDAAGTGIVINGNRILTNAHLVIHSRHVTVQPFQSADKYRATITQIAPGPDLAILVLDDDSFFDTHPPAPLADELPKIGNSVNVYGYPVGGQALSITKGVISRIEFADYFIDWQGLVIQIDAALNHGNSGGPAASDGTVIGLCFSAIEEAENIGYVIPTEEIRAFLSDIEDGSYEGSPQLFDRTQTLENPALRAKLRVEKETSGVMVTEPAFNDPDYPLRRWDVLTAIGDFNIDNDGMVDIGDNLRLLYRYLVPRLASAGTVSLSVYREGKLLTLDVPARTEPNRLVKFLGAEAPSYFIYGPLVFTPVYGEFSDRFNEEYLMAAEYLISRSNPMATRGAGKPDFEGEELVVVPTPLFPHPMIDGYEPEVAPVLESVNGIKIKNLRHLVETLGSLKDEFVIFEWADSGAETMVFRRSEIAEATEENLELSGIRAQCSKDLRGVWIASK